MTDHTESLPTSPTAPPASPSGRRRRFLAVLAAGCLLAGTALAAGLLRERPRPAPEPPDLAKEAQADLDRRNYKPLSEPLTALLADPAYKPIPTQAHPLLGQPAPDFSLPDTDGKRVSLAESLKSGPVVLVFYYGYHCNHCVSQLFALNKDIDKLRELGATVLTVSADPSDQTRERFKQYGAFGFPVLSDPSNAVAAKYGTYTPSAKQGEDGDLLHGTFVIDRAGRVVWANRGDGPFTENRTLLLEIHRERSSGGIR
jgi:peroxiredoxin